jgi:hypothetical protein
VGGAFGYDVVAWRACGKVVAFGALYI